MRILTITAAALFVSGSLLLQSPAAFAQQTTCGVFPGQTCGLMPTPPVFNNNTAPPPVFNAAPEVPVSPLDPVPGSTSVGGQVGTLLNPTTPCTGQVFSATGC
jgi:hypothetical protein